MRLRRIVGPLTAFTACVCACSVQTQDSPHPPPPPPASASASTLHDAEVARAKAFIEARYAASDVRSSFKSKLGDTIDCIDFFAQPGVKALARRGSPITQLPPPAEKPRRVGAVDDVSFDGSIDWTSQFSWWSP